MSLASSTIAIKIILRLQNHLQLHKVIYLADLAKRTLIAIRVIHILNSCSEKNKFKNYFLIKTNNRGQMSRFAIRQGANVWGASVLEANVLGGHMTRTHVPSKYQIIRQQWKFAEFIFNYLQICYVRFVYLPQLDTITSLLVNLYIL